VGYGSTVDRVIGWGSRLLHLRPAKTDTVADLEPYLDRPLEELFPAPPRLEDPKRRRTALDRAMRASTVSWESSHEVICPRYRKRHEGEYRKNLTAHLRWLRPDRRPRRDCLLYVHGWLEPGPWADETTLFRKWARELDCDIAHVCLPFHGARNPRSALFSGEYFWTADLVRSVEGVRQAVCDARTAIDWLRREGGYRYVGATGLSLGGSLAMILGCLEPGPDYIVPMMSHLQLADAVERASILWRMKHDLERWGHDEAERRRLFDRLGWHRARPALPLDRQLWVQARADRYIIAPLAESQWRDWGEPPILWIEGGHMTFPLQIDAMTRRIADFQRDLPG